MLRLIRTRSALAALLIPTLASVGVAQVNPTRRADATVPRGYGDLGFTVAQPLGAFGDFINEGYGLSGGFVWNLDRDRVFGIRIEGGFVQYDRETKDACLVNCRFPIDINTTNNIAFGGIGPQLTVPAGPIRPYLNATAGFSYFYTESSLESTDDFDDHVYDATNHDDAVFAWTGGGGIMIPLSLRRTQVLLDLGARYHRNGEATYLRKGSIRDNPDGSITITPIQSEANFITYRIGISIGVPTR